MPGSGARLQGRLLLHSGVQAGRGSVEPQPLGEEVVPRIEVLKEVHLEVADRGKKKAVHLLSPPHPPHLRGCGDGPCPSEAAPLQLSGPGCGSAEGK
jgi:hypothetical protein